ncbi:alpha-tocopherol transfer protein-like [Agrilus planipennis]|uniref:Alpha-tocopherol transfer protein-like n=1 Tax=Agrilus planipennis TaxID=224129 RepID=A0A1W4WK00_AGRPL|nr:alpha-tocopherol transfer protein-like [Agrilus planipennis]
MDILLGPNVKQMEAIKNELGEDEDRFENNRKLLQKWISCQPHLPQNYDPGMLRVFLRGCKHNLERAKKKIEAYFVARLTIPEFYACRNPTVEELENAFQCVHILPLSKLTNEGHRVTILKLASTDPSDFDIKTILRLLFMIADIRTAEEQPIAGDVFIYDTSGLTAEHCVRFISPLVKKAVMLAHNIYPQRLHKVHIVNASPLGERLLQFTKSLLKEKLRNRFIVHKTPDTLLEYVPKDVLPVEYCGTEGSLNELISTWTKCILAHAEWFQTQENVKASTTIPSSVIHACGLEDGLGIQGSFRQLAID